MNAIPEIPLENGFKNVTSMNGGFEAWRQVYEHEAG
jgi:rhodanese-related sulfurtransferase